MSDLELYARYERWKDWAHPFAFTPDEASYFRGECYGIRVAGANLLEIGFGSGSFLAWARAEGATVFGTEVNESAVRAAEAVGISLLPPEIGSVSEEYCRQFDTIVAFDVFEHLAIAEIRRALDAAENMLKDGGHLLLRFPNVQSPFGLAPQFGDPTHRSALSRSVFDLLLQGRSLSVVRYGGAYRIGGGGPLRAVKRHTRYALQSLLAASLRFIYATDIPYDAVVTLVIRKTVGKEQEWYD